MSNLKRDAFNADVTARSKINQLIVERGVALAERDDARFARDAARIERDDALSKVAAQAIEISELQKDTPDEIPDL